MTLKETYLGLKTKLYKCSTCYFSEKLKFKNNDNKVIRCRLYNETFNINNVCIGNNAKHINEKLIEIKKKQPLSFYFKKKEIKPKKKIITNQLKLF